MWKRIGSRRARIFFSSIDNPGKKRTEKKEEQLTRMNVTENNERDVIKDS